MEDIKGIETAEGVEAPSDTAIESSLSSIQASVRVGMKESAIFGYFY